MKKHLLNCMKVFAVGLLSVISMGANAQVSINSFTPTSGPVGTTVTLNGSGFNTLLGSNAVFFGTIPASIQSIASSTQMTVTVPAGANYQYIFASNLTAGLIGTTGYSSKPFVVTYSPNGSNNFRSKSTLTSGSSASARNVYFADMNNDGKPDLVVANSNNTISIFPNQTTSSTGTASFGSVVTLGTASGSVSAALALGDADSDGKLDVMAVFSGTNSVAFYRNTTASAGATPSFAGIATFGTAASPIAINMVDFDGDGNSDLVVASNLATNNVSVLRNLGLVLGSLSFLAAQTFSAGTNPSGLAIGDIDGDGNVDIAVSNRSSNNVSVLRNTSTLLGGINFASAVALTAGSSPTAVAIGDFDGDNKLDLATANGSANSISILRNTSSSGNISFAVKSDFSVGTTSGPQHLGLGDTNGDSKVDIVSANLGNSTVSILRNASSSGSISFSVNVDVSNVGSTSPTSIAVGDINADSKPDLILATSGTSSNVSIFLQKVTQALTITSGSNLAVDASLSVTANRSVTPTSLGGNLSYAITAGSGSATVNGLGTFTAISVGTITLTVTAVGTTDYDAASTTQLVTIGKATPTLSVSVSSTLVVDGSMTGTTITTATLGRGGNVNYALVAGSGSATVNATTGLIRGVRVGTVTLTSTATGDVDYLPSSTTQLFTVDKATPTLIIISADVLGLNAFMNVIAESNATLNRGGAFSYAAEGGSGSVTIDSTTGLVTGLSTGTVTITVASAGDGNYYPSLATQLLNVAASTPTLTITSSDQVDVDGTLTATTISTAPFGFGGVITYAIEAGSGSASVDPNSGRVLGINAGTVTLIASSAGDTIYGASSTSQTLQVNMTTPSFTIVSSADLHVDEIINVAISTTASHDIGLLEYAVENDTGIAYVDETGVLTAFGVGQVTLTVNSLGNADYLSSSTSQLITISKSTPTVLINSIDYVYVDDFIVADATSNATGGRGGYFSFEIIGGSGSATIDLDSGQLTGISVGSITLVALTSGDSDYYPGRETQVVNILRSTPTLTVLGPYEMVAQESITASVLMSATRNRGGAINYFIQPGSGSATVDPDTGLITSIHAGTVTLEVTSAGDTDFYPTSVQQEISIDKILPALAIISDANLFVDQTLAASGTTSATPGFGGNFYYTIEAGSGSASVDVNTGLVTAIGAGTVTLMLSSLGDADYYPASVTQVLSIEKVTPTLNITSTTAEVDNDFTVGVQSSATGGRGGELTYHIEAGSGSATVDEVTGFVHPIHVGTVTLTVTSAGDADYYGTSVSHLLTIEKGTPTLVITSSNTLAVDGTMTITYTSSAVEPAAVSYSGQNGTGIVVVVSNTGKVTGVQVGTAAVKVTTAGSANYNPVTVSMSITLVKATPTLTITAPSGSTMVRGTSLTVTFVTSATFNRGGAKSYAVSAGTGSATINPTTGRLTALTAGTISITVSTSGDANYYQRSQSKVITITAAMMSVGGTATQPEDKFNPESNLVGDGQSEEFGASGIPDEEKVVVTRLISPNGDGLNDVLTISHIEDHPGNELVIANRDGEMVFKAYGYDNSGTVFSGRSNTGTPLPNGVYYYTLSYFAGGKLKQCAGYFQLRR